MAFLVLIHYFVFLHILILVFRRINLSVSLTLHCLQIPFGLKLVPVATDAHGLVPASLDAIMTKWDVATQVHP